MPKELKKAIREIPDFPKKGILFYDITTLFSDARAFRRSVDMFAHRYIDRKPDLFVGVEARGFLMAAALAYALGTGVVVIRKPGKLPRKTHKASYDLEYGSSEIEIHQDAISAGQRVVLVDDLLATGGTINAAVELVDKLGGDIIEIAFLVELTFLNGRKNLTDYEIHSLVKYD
ncbi:Adenine phosphoribosyltransferase [hydrothermal vent metagenome]|uniref:adenine phosphoribosyltransferase n=1 Tax=hydrothermal vent metagenome TaxID=652676 RepID=A0A3B1C633_9ZZZZ